MRTIKVSEAEASMILSECAPAKKRGDLGSRVDGIIGYVRGNDFRRAWWYTEAWSTGGEYETALVATLLEVAP